MRGLYGIWDALQRGYDMWVMNNGLWQDSAPVW